MKSAIPLLASAMLLALPLPASAQEGVKEDDFLFFDKIEEDAKAVPKAPEPAPAEDKVEPSARPLPGSGTAALRIIALDVPDKSFAVGKLTTLTATASQRGNRPEPVVDFPGATVSLRESIDRAAAKLIAANPKFPDGLTLRVEPAEEYHGHERDAAAVATALLLEAVGTGRELDPGAVVLGGVGADGRITGVQRLATRLRTLEGEPPPVIGVPMVSEEEVRDLALMNELEVLVKHQIISMVTLDDARALTAKERPEKVKQAMALFAPVAQAAGSTPLASLLKNPKFLQRLKEVATLMPNHLSARLLLQAATGKLPGRITLATSRQAILKATKPFVDATGSGGDAKTIKTAATEAGNVLLRLQPKIHPTVERYLMAVKAYLRGVNNFLDIRTDAQYAQMRYKAQVELGRLLADVETEKQKLDKSAGTTE